MKRTAFLSLIMLMGWSSSGQITFENTYGNSSIAEKGNSVCISADRGYAITGSNAVIGPYFGDVWMIKISQEGDSLWEKYFDGGFSDEGNSIAKCNDNGYILCGESGTGLNQGLFLIKTNDGCYKKIDTPVISIQLIDYESL